MGQESFVFYRSFYKAIKKLDNDTLAAVVRAMCAYALDDEEAELEGVAEIIFDMAKPQIDANSKRRSDGAKGGRPKKETSGLKKEKPVVSENKNHRLENEKPNVNVNANENVNEKEKEKEREKESADKPHRSFVPPTMEEVSAYCRERKNGIDAQSFVDFYASKGWFVGKNKMKDWKACVRTWEQRSRGQPKSKIEIDSNFRNFIEQNQVIDWETGG